MEINVKISTAEVIQIIKELTGGSPDAVAAAIERLTRAAVEHETPPRRQ